MWSFFKFMNMQFISTKIKAKVTIIISPEAGISKPH